MWRYRIIIIICLIVGVGLLSFWLSRTEKSVTAPIVPVPSPTPGQPIVHPIFPSPALITKKPTYKIDVAPKPAHATVPLFRMGPAGELSLLAKRFALAFGKPGNPKIFSASGKTYYSWSDNMNTFSVSGSPVEVAHQIPLSQSLSPISEPVSVFGALAQSFLVSKGLVPAGASLSPPEVSYYAPIGNEPIQTTADKALIVRLDYRLLLDGLPLYVGSPEIPIFSFRFDGLKTLVSFTGFYFGSFQKGGAVNVLPAEKAMAALYSRGSLVYVFAPDDVNDVRTKRYTPGVITIKDATLGYYYDAGQSLVVPIYVFKGLSNQINTKKALNTTTFLPAVENQ